MKGKRCITNLASSVKLKGMHNFLILSRDVQLKSMRQKAISHHAEC